MASQPIAKLRSSHAILAQCWNPQAQNLSPEDIVGTDITSWKVVWCTCIYRGYCHSHEWCNWH